MKIEVTFGLSLDGAAGQDEDGLGKLRVGPAGLLGFDSARWVKDTNFTNCR